MEQDALTFTVEEAARILGISRTLAYEAVREGSIPSIKIGARLLVLRKPLLATLRQTAVAEQATTRSRIIRALEALEDGDDPLGRKILMELVEDGAGEDTL